METTKSIKDLKALLEQCVCGKLVKDSDGTLRSEEPNDEVISEVERLNAYKLCYIDEISTTYWDYTPEAKAYRETEEWKEQNRLRDEKFHREGHMSSDDQEFGYYTNPILRKGSESQDYPNPEYIEGEQELFAYFTPLDLDEQWGDDWDDYPYEYNAGAPYDSKYEERDEKGSWKEYEIIKVPFYVDSWKVYQPKEWGRSSDNSPFCVRDINAGAVAWIYYAGEDGKSSKGSVAIHAGVNPFEFIEKIEKINNG